MSTRKRRKIIGKKAVLKEDIVTTGGGMFEKGEQFEVVRAAKNGLSTLQSLKSRRYIKNIEINKFTVEDLL